MPWWSETEEPTPFAARAVAYYRHSAQDRQKNSVEIQSDQVRAWATDHHVEIIQEFSDRGKSGLTADGFIRGGGHSVHLCVGDRAGQNKGQGNQTEYF